MSTPSYQLLLTKDFDAKESKENSATSLTKVFSTKEFTSNAISPFLDNTSLSSFSRTCRNYRNLCVERKAEELLQYVLNPDLNPNSLKRFKKFFAEDKLFFKRNAKTPIQEEMRSFILTPAHGREFYHNTRQGGFLTKREYSYKISPLEAAFKLCGDFHLVKFLLDNVPENQKHLALEQLQKVRANCSPETPGNYLFDLTQLRNAYAEFLEEAVPVCVNWSNQAYRAQCELHRLSGLLGESQKNQPWFILQCFKYSGTHIDPSIFLDRIDRHHVFFSFDFESLGSNTHYALFRTLRIRTDRHGESYCTFEDKYRNGWTPKIVNYASIDAEIFEDLYKLIPSRLDSIIQSLERELELNARPRKSFCQKFCCIR